jgi:hypothetical protein
MHWVAATVIVVLRRQLAASRHVPIGNCRPVTAAGGWYPVIRDCDRKSPLESQSAVDVDSNVSGSRQSDCYNVPPGVGEVDVGALVQSENFGP